MRPYVCHILEELEKGWMKKQADKAIAYYEALPQWKKDMLKKI